MASVERPRLVFLLAPTGRSGTNYLFRLIVHHPYIAGPEAPFWEDFLLHEAHHLSTYAGNVFGHWSEVADETVPPSTRTDLERALGDALCRLLTRRVEVPHAITKTPSVENIDLIDRFFPDERLILLIRDGRDVVASGMGSFDWTLEQGAAYWAAAMDRLLAFCARTPKARRLILRFEDLITDPKAVLDRVFDHVGADPADFDWTADGLDQVVGSSTLRRSEGDLHWTPIERPKDFNPLGRWQRWNEEEKRVFERLAGRQLEALETLS